MTRGNTSRLWITLMAGTALSVGLAGCAEADNTAEDTAEAVDTAADTTEAAVDDMAAETQDMATDMADGAEDMADSAGDWGTVEGAPSGEYTNDPGHSRVTVEYMHQGYSPMMIQWMGFDSTLNWNAEDPAASSVMATFELANLDTGVSDFDDHLKSEDFFLAETYPTITFESTEITRTGVDTGTMTGDLTVKDITKPVTLDVTFHQAGESRGSYKVGFSAEGEITRSEFGIGLYAPSTSDVLDLTIGIEYTMPVDGSAE